MKLAFILAPWLATIFRSLDVAAQALPSLKDSTQATQAEAVRATDFISPQHAPRPRRTAGDIAKDIAAFVGFPLASVTVWSLAQRLAKVEGQAKITRERTGRNNAIVSENMSRLTYDIKKAKALLSTAAPNAQKLALLEEMVNRLEYGLTQTAVGEKYDVREWVPPNDMDPDMEDCVRLTSRYLHPYRGAVTDGYQVNLLVKMCVELYRDDGVVPAGWIVPDTHVFKIKQKPHFGPYAPQGEPPHSGSGDGQMLAFSAARAGSGAFLRARLTKADVVRYLKDAARQQQSHVNHIGGGGVPPLRQLRRGRRGIGAFS